MKKVIIFGLGNIGELAHYYLENDSDYSVCGFTVDKEFLEDDSFKGLPVIPFEEVDNVFSQDEYSMFIALSYAKMNKVREQKYIESKKKGYKIISYISSKATIFDNVKTGENCFILENNVIQPFVEIGNNCTLWSGNHIGHHSRIMDNCFISSHVVVSGGVTISNNCFLGVNSTIRDHVKIGKENIIGAGSLILSDTEDFKIYKEKETNPSKVPSYKLKKI